MRRRRVYVAGPIRGDGKVDPWGNMLTAIKAAEQLFQAGYAPFVPQLCVQWHSLCAHVDAEWLSIDLPWVEVADLVVRLPGFSAGADEEVRHAEELGVPVMTLEEALRAVTPRLCT